MTDIFSRRLAAWQDYADSPWGRIRYAVIGETLRRETSRLGPGLRILDVGGGDGRDALPLARAGHRVTILDQSRSWLDEAGRRAVGAGVQVDLVQGDLAAPPALVEFDVVLCHFVLQYLPDDVDHLATLASAVRPGGFVSLVLPNPAGMVLRALVTAGPGAALSELEAGSKHAVLVEHDVRKLEWGELERAVTAAGLRVTRRYGGRIANDLLVDDYLKNDTAYVDDLLRLELSLCDREPYLRVGAFYQVIATKP